MNLPPSYRKNCWLFQEHELFLLTHFCICHKFLLYSYYFSFVIIISPIATQTIVTNVISPCAVYQKMTYNITMSELPFTCPTCNKENMVDMESLDGKPINKIVTELGFMCECGTWIRVSYTTRSLEDALNKLEKKSPGSAGYHFHFARTLRKAEGVQEKYGGF